MDPVKAKLIARWLTERVNEFEKQFGNIPSVEGQQQAAGIEADGTKKTVPGVT